MHHRTAADQIRALFLRAQPAYTHAEVLDLLGIAAEILDAAIRDGEITPQPNDCGTTVLLWEDVAHLALEQWTLRMIHIALGTSAAAVIPHLNQHATIRVSLPHYQIRLLDHEARCASEGHRLPRNASDILTTIIEEWLNAQDLTTLEASIPGISQAITFPYYTPRGNYHRCRYCDVAITELARAVCNACVAHHEPKEHVGEYRLPALEEP